MDTKVEYFFRDPQGVWRRTERPCTTRDAAAAAFLILHPGYTGGYTAPILTEHDRGALVDPRSVVHFTFSNEKGIVHDRRGLAQARVK